MAANSQDWMVTFFYEQELRSYYMNGILNAALKPGVHNASMALFVEDPATSTDAESSSITSGIFLYIKQGTTFIFSNSYKKVGDVYERDFENVGTYLIKCVALTDIVKPLASWSTNQGMSPAAKNLLGPNRSAVHYCTAYIKYNPDDKTDTLEPSFALVRANENYAKEIKNKDSIYFRSPYVDADDIANDPFKLPDGCKTYFDKGVSEMKYISWLNLGAVTERPGVKVANPNYSYYSGVAWNEKGTSIDGRTTSGSTSWIKDHVFSARGLQEYRQEFSKETFRKSPDFILDPLNRNLYLDIGNVYDDDAVYSQTYDWNTVHRIGEHSESIPASYSLSFPAESLSNMLKDFFKRNKYVPDSSRPVEAVLVDAVFMTSNKRQSHSAVELQDVLTSLQDKATTNNPSIIGARWIAKANNNNFNPAFDAEEDAYKIGGEMYTVLHKDYQYSKETLTNHIISPLDVSEANFERLLSNVANKNIWPIIIDKLRLEGKFDPVTTTSLIPVCLAFRKFRTIDGVNWTSVDGISSAAEIHPANILSCFDIQNNSTKLGAISVKSNDVYSILPIIK